MTCRKCNQLLPNAALYCCFCGVKQAIPAHSPKRRGNGQGTVYKTADGKYRAVVTVSYVTAPDGTHRRKTRSRRFTKKSDALLYIPQLFDAPAKTKAVTLYQLHEQYLQSKDYESLGASQHDKMRYAWNRLAPLYSMKITDITVADMENTINAATETYYPARDMKVLLSHLFTIAVKSELVTANKTEYIDLPDPPKAKRQSWTREEVDAMWKDYQDGNAFAAYPLIMCYSGLRHGELNTLKLENIDLNRHIMIGGIKTEAGTDREIPIHDRILPLIAAIIPQNTEYLCELTDTAFYWRYWSMIDRIGIRRLPPHTCRHWYFSSMTAAGVQSGIITETGGHASYITTMKNYVRIPFDDKLKAVNSIE